jgi:pyruvate, water dikinase
MIVPLDRAARPDLFGGKAAQLGTALAAGLPVPSGLALSWALVEALAGDEAELLAASRKLLDTLGAPLAVRSSAIGEDSKGASFAGQHQTRLGVYTADELAGAIRGVHASAFTLGALAYRQRLGVAGLPRMGVVVQRLIAAECAGVLFTRNPLTGADERAIEAAWGLGEAVVAGLVTPDRYRLARDGALLEQEAGEKDLALRLVPGGVREEEVHPELVHRLCLDAEALWKLHTLALRCERAFGPDLDLEWAFDGTDMHLLQHRPITRSAAA